MNSKVILVSVFSCLLKAIFCQNCDPGICSTIPGLVYNPELDQCAWPDEVGCSLQDLGYSSSCDGMSLHELKAADFDLRDLPEGRDQAQYFVVCVPMVTETDRLVKSLLPTGPLVPRLLGCPGSMIFDASVSQCRDV